MYCGGEQVSKTQVRNLALHLDVDGDLGHAGLAHEGAALHVDGAAGAQQVHEIMKSASRVDNVLDNDDVAPRNVLPQVHDNLDRPRRVRARVARHGHELDAVRHRHQARQIGQEDEGALQDAQQHQRALAVAVVAVDASRQLGSLGGNVSRREEHSLNVGMRLHACPLMLTL